MNPMMFATGESIQNAKMKQMAINSSYNQSQGKGMQDQRNYTDWGVENEQGIKHEQVKASMIQMRKINPISKTTTGSKNTSIDRKKS